MPSAAPQDARTECACKGIGWLVLDLPKTHKDFGKAVRCPHCTDWIKVSRLTVEERKHKIDDITDRDDDTRDEMMALRFLGKQMLSDPFGFLAIYGRKGGGKSLLLTALVAEFCRANRQAAYFNASEVVSLTAYGEEKEIDGFQKVGNYEGAKAILKKIPVLAIDEVDKIKWTPWQIQQIGEVLEHRHRHADTHVTLFAMNRPPWEWSNAGDVEHIASRLSDGRFYRRWPEDKLRWLPKCANGDAELPGLFEVTLPDIRPTLRRY